MNINIWRNKLESNNPNFEKEKPTSSTFNKQDISAISSPSVGIFGNLVLASASTCNPDANPTSTLHVELVSNLKYKKQSIASKQRERIKEKESHFKQIQNPHEREYLEKELYSLKKRWRQLYSMVENGEVNIYRYGEDSSANSNQQVYSSNVPIHNLLPSSCTVPNDPLRSIHPILATSCPATSVVIGSDPLTLLEHNNVFFSLATLPAQTILRQKTRNPSSNIVYIHNQPMRGVRQYSPPNNRSMTQPNHSIGKENVLEGPDSNPSYNPHSCVRRKVATVLPSNRKIYDPSLTKEERRRYILSCMHQDKPTELFTRTGRPVSNTFRYS